MTTKANSGFDECVGVARFIMKVVGVWPLDDAKGIITRYRFLLPISAILFLIIIPQTRKIINTKNDLELKLDILTTADLIEIIALIKMITIYVNKQELGKIIYLIETDWKITNSEEQRKMWKNATMSKWITLFSITSAIGSVFMHNIVFLFTIRNDIAWKNSSVELPLFLNSQFWFDLNYQPVYVIICLFQCISTYASSFAFCSYDTFYVFAILHLSGQLYNLRTRIENLVEYHREKGESFPRVLMKVVCRHQHLVSHADIIEESFKNTFLMQVICITILICLQGYQIVVLLNEHILKSLADLIFMIVFIIGNGISIFLYCFIAEIIRTESEELCLSVYKMKWYELPPRDSILLVIVMNRFQLPIELTVGKFAVLSMIYYANVVKMSIGYLSVLLAVRNKLQ